MIIGSQEYKDQEGWGGGGVTKAPSYVVIRHEKKHYQRGFLINLRPNSHRAITLGKRLSWKRDMLALLLKSQNNNPLT